MMRTANLVSWRVTVLASLGVIHGCGGQAFTTADRDGGENTKEASTAAGRATATSKPGSGAGGAAMGGSPVQMKPPIVKPPEPGAGGATTDPVDPVDPPVDPVDPPVDPVDPPVDPVDPADPPVDPPEPTGSCGGGAQKDLGGGLVQCEDGVVHRQAAVACQSALPRDVKYEKGEFFRCTSDADCVERAHGYCQKYPPGQIGEESSGCNYGCVADSDCAAGQLCECGDPVGTCVAAPDCTTTADCAADSRCARYQYSSGCGDSVGYACLSDKDQCMINGQCAAGMTCNWTAEGRQCQPALCAVGRPFIVDGAERLANTARRDDWRATTEGAVGVTLSPEERAQVSGAWANIGLMEHASVAAFARFSLQLLSLAAPSPLIEACNQAMVDETLHAKLAFGLSSQVSGKAVGPGRLPMDHALDTNDLESVVLGAVLEGCIGETVAAVEAAQGLSTAQEPVVVSALARIAEDERRHADLAWQFVRWALTQDASLAPKIQALVAREIACSAGTGESSPEPVLARFGLVSAAARQNLRRDVLREVVAPCIDALCSHVAVPSRAGNVGTQLRAS